MKSEKRPLLMQETIIKTMETEDNEEYRKRAEESIRKKFHKTLFSPFAKATGLTSHLLQLLFLIDVTHEFAHFTFQFSHFAAKWPN